MKPAFAMNPCPTTGSLVCWNALLLNEANRLNPSLSLEGRGESCPCFGCRMLGGVFVRTTPRASSKALKKNSWDLILQVETYLGTENPEGKGLLWLLDPIQERCSPVRSGGGEHCIKE